MKKLFFALFTLIFFPAVIIWIVVKISQLVNEKQDEEETGDGKWEMGFKVPTKKDVGEWIIGALENMAEEAVNKIEEKADASTSLSMTHIIREVTYM
jgi:hypothetical protein